MKYLWCIFVFFLTSCATKGILETHILQGEPGEVDVIVFSSTDCPIANAMAPEIERIHTFVQNAGGDLFLVHVWAGRTSIDAQKHADDYGLTMEVLIDTEHELVASFNATVTPEAVVVLYDEDGTPKVIYQGLVNNLFDSPGNRRDEATQHYVRDAVAAGIKNEAISTSYRAPTGCIIEQKQ